MHQHNKIQLWIRTVGTKISVLLFLFCVLAFSNAFSQQPNKIQQAINAIRAVNNNEKDDYVTDGQRTVWVKSYKKWMPEDLALMKKEDPSTLRFLTMAAQRARYDVLDQLLPDYYSEHGGVKVFAADILKQQVVTQVTATTRKN